MKKAFAVATIVLAVSGVGLAQTASTTTLPLKPVVSTMTQEFRVSKILGTNVKNVAGETIGEVKDLVRLQDNEVLQALVSVGGFLGIGDTLVAIPYDKLQIQRVDDDVQVMYNATKAELEDMPKFLDTEEDRAQLTLRARDLIGANVKNTNDDTIGEITDLMITSAQDIPQAIVSIGGFLGMGERLVAIPFDTLVIRRVNDKEHVTYNATPEELKAMPAFNHS